MRNLKKLSEEMIGWGHYLEKTLTKGELVQYDIHLPEANLSEIKLASEIIDEFNSKFVGCEANMTVNGLGKTIKTTREIRTADMFISIKATKPNWLAHYIQFCWKSITFVALTSGATFYMANKCHDVGGIETIFFFSIVNILSLLGHGLLTWGESTTINMRRE